MNIVKIADFNVGGSNPLALIAGPCVIESRDHCLFMAEQLKEITAKIGINFVFKASYDKANRTSISSFRGPGIDEGLNILSEVKQQFGVPVLSDVHTEEQADIAKEVLDIIQVPAFLCRQTDLVVAIAKTGKVVNVKKGQFLSPEDMKNVVTKVEESGNKQILLTDRGASFGYNRLVSDMRALPIMRSLGYPVVFDATHSVQEPGGKGTSSGGKREFVPTLARAATAAGIDLLFMEVHDNPEHAKSDGANMILIDDLEKVLNKIMAIDKIVRD